MRSGIVRVSGLLMMICAMIEIGGCGAEGSYAADDGALPAAYVAGQRGVLRVREDGARGRTWVLAIDGVRVHDIAKKKLIRRVQLPDWDVANLACDPDMVLDGSGSAIVSSNVRLKLWRIDAETFALQERDITLREREQWDVGFGALMLAADGNLLGLTSTGGWLWKIDLATGNAYLWNWGAPILNVCDLMRTDTEIRCGPEEARLC